MPRDEDKTIFHVDSAHKREELPEFDQIEPCPKCGGETETGYGMAGGGMGIYAYCPKCEVITSKSTIDD
jgi:hypothetical protein